MALWGRAGGLTWQNSSGAASTRGWRRMAEAEVAAVGGTRQERRLAVAPRLVGGGVVCGGGWWQRRRLQGRRRRHIGGVCVGGGGTVGERWPVARWRRRRHRRRRHVGLGVVGEGGGVGGGGAASHVYRAVALGEPRGQRRALFMPRPHATCRCAPQS